MTSNRPFLWIDTETGGTDPSRHSLLSVAFVMHHAVGEKSMEIFIRHDTYQVEAAALRVNRIDLAAHDAAGMRPATVVAALETFLDTHFGSERVCLAGHNVAFDRAFLVAFLQQHGPHLLRRFHHRTLCTQTLAVALCDAGLLDVPSVGLSDLVARFQIPLTASARHTALGDAWATRELYRHLVALLQSAPAADCAAR